MCVLLVVEFGTKKKINRKNAKNQTETIAHIKLKRERQIERERESAEKDNI